MHAHLGLLAHCDQLIDGVQHRVAVTPGVRGDHAIRFLEEGGYLYDLICAGIHAWRIHQSGGKPEHSRINGLLCQLTHMIQLGLGRRASSHAHGCDAECAVGTELSTVHHDTLVTQAIQEIMHGLPIPIQWLVHQELCVALQQRPGGWAQRGWTQATVSGNHGCDPLAHERLNDYVVICERQKKVNVCVEIDEAWTHDQTLGIYHATGHNSSAGPQKRYSLSGNPQIRLIPRGAGAVYDLTALDK